MARHSIQQHMDGHDDQLKHRSQTVDNIDGMFRFDAVSMEPVRPTNFCQLPFANWSTFVPRKSLFLVQWHETCTSMIECRYDNRRIDFWVRCTRVRFFGNEHL